MQDIAGDIVKSHKWNERQNTTLCWINCYFIFIDVFFILFFLNCGEQNIKIVGP